MSRRIILFVSFGIYYIYKLLREGPRNKTQATDNVTGYLVSCA